jgi:hypothetical protein
VTSRQFGLRALLATLLAGAAVAHLPVTPEHLHEAPYMGSLFAAFALGALGLAAVVLVATSRRSLELSGGLCLLALATYAATRLVGFPQLSDDVGNWLEPWGVVSVLIEAAAVVTAIVALAEARAHR